MRGNVTHMQSIYTFLTILILFQYLVLVADWISGISQKMGFKAGWDKAFLHFFTKYLAKKLRKTLFNLHYKHIFHFRDTQCVTNFGGFIFHNYCTFCTHISF